MAALLVATGCSFFPKARRLDPGERLELPGFTVEAPREELRAPEGPTPSAGSPGEPPAPAGWFASRSNSPGATSYLVNRAGHGHHGGLPDLLVGEIRPGLAGIEGTLKSWQAPTIPGGGGEPLPSVLAPGLGGEAVAGWLGGPGVVSRAFLAFPLAGRGTLGVLEVRGVVSEPAHRERLEARLRGVAAGLRFRPPGEDGEGPTSASSSRFPKVLGLGLADRSLTLPQAGLRWDYRRAWRLGTDGGFRGPGLAIGLHDRVELDAPGYLRVALGDPDALARPEWAIGVGNGGWTHDARAGSTWSPALSAEWRRRPDRRVAWVGQATVWLDHESRTRRDRPWQAASTGVVWDAAPFLALGLEAGEQCRLEGRGAEPLLYLGGLHRPLVAANLLWIQVGLLGAVALRERAPAGYLGFSFALTL